MQSAGFRFAINMDPIQFEVYAGSISGKAWNVRLNASYGTSSPMIAVLPTPGINTITLTVQNTLM